MAAFSETRDDRIREYHVVNANPVVGLEEGSWVVVEDGVTTIRGAARVKLFRQGADPVWFDSGVRLPVSSPRALHRVISTECVTGTAARPGRPFIGIP